MIDAAKYLGACLGVACALATAPARAQFVCGYPKLVTPVSTDLTTSKPPIEWEAIAGAQYYRVTITSRLPEGRILAAIDTQVPGTHFVPPQPLAETRANIRIGVTAYCNAEPNAALAPQEPARFLINASANCALRSEVHVDGTGRRRILTWDAVAGANAYRVVAYSAFDGTLVTQQTTRAAKAELDAPTANPVVVGIRPECATGVGDQVHALVLP